MLCYHDIGISNVEFYLKRPLIAVIPVFSALGIAAVAEKELKALK